MSSKSKLAFWFRYGPAEHAELFHALPEVIEKLSRSTDVYYYGLKTGKAIPQKIRDNATIRLLPFTVNRKSTLDKLLKTFTWICCLPYIALRCRLDRVDVVYIDETIPFTAAIAKLFFGGKVAITVVDFFSDIYFKHDWLKPIGQTVKRIDEWSWKSVDGILTRAKATTGYLTEVGINPDIVKTIYDPCDSHTYYPVEADARSKARVKYGYSYEDVVLVHHGILHPNKGNDLILRSLAKIRVNVPKLKYLLVGDGPEMGNLTRLVNELGISDIVKFTGWLEKPSDVNEALNAADIGLVMRVGARSDDFHMTGALVHSMAVGLPVCAASLGGIREVVVDGEHGWTFSPTDMNTFEEAVTHLAQNPVARARMGQSAYRASLRLFDMSAVIENTSSWLKRLVDEKY